MSPPRGCPSVNAPGPSRHTDPRGRFAHDLSRKPEPRRSRLGVEEEGEEGGGVGAAGGASLGHRDSDATVAPRLQR